MDGDGIEELVLPSPSRTVCQRDIVSSLKRFFSPVPDVRTCLDFLKYRPVSVLYNCIGFQLFRIIFAHLMFKCNISQILSIIIHADYLYTRQYGNYRFQHLSDNAISPSLLSALISGTL